VSTVGDALPREQARCRELLREYAELGPVGRFGYVMIENALRRADEAAITGDLVGMIQALVELRECK
jgi:hypothetical protein